MHSIFSTQQQFFGQASPVMNGQCRTQSWLGRAWRALKLPLLLVVLMLTGLPTTYAATPPAAVVASVNNSNSNGADLPFNAYGLEANQTVVYGPKTARIKSTAGATDVFTNLETYAVPIDAEAPFYLQIDNTSATIPKNKSVTVNVVLNGSKVATTANLFDTNGKGIPKFSTVVQSNSAGNLISVTVSGNSPLAFSYRIIGTKKPVQATKPINFTPSAISVVNGSTAVTKVALSPLPTAAGTLALTSSNAAIAKVPATVAFVAGQANVDVPVQGLAVGQATIQAGLNATTISASVSVTPAPASLVTLVPSIQTLQLGASGQMQLTIAPAQTQATVVQLASSDATKVTLAASVSIPAGQTTVSFAIQGLAVGTAQVTATLPSTNGGAASTLSSQVQVITPPPTVVALLPATTTLQMGGTGISGSLTVQISAAQTTATVVQVSTRTTGIVSVPATVSIPAGQTQVSIALQTLATGNTIVVASLNGSTVEAAVQVNPAPPTLANVAPLNLSLITGATGQLTVALKATHTTDTVVTLSASPAGILAIPASVTILAGQTQAIVSITAATVGQAQIVATLPTGSKNATVDVVPPAAQLTQMLPNPLNVQQGAAANVALKLNAAQLNPVQVTLSAAQATILQVPANVTIAAGQLTQTFAVQGLQAGTTQLSASINGSTQAIDVVVTLPPPTLATLEPATKSLPKGKLGKLKLTLSSTAQAPTLITLSNSNASVLGAPDQVTVPAGQLQLDIPITALTLGQSTITASLNGSTLSSVVTVIEPEIVSIAIEPSPFKVSVGQTSPAKATGTYSDGSTRDITQEAATAWATGNSALATVNPVSGIKGGVIGVTAGATTLTAEQAILPSADDPSPNPIKGSVTLEVGSPLALALSAPQTQLQVGQSTIVSITAPYPAGATPIVIALTSSTTSGTGALQFPSTATIGAGLASVNVTVTATSAGAGTSAVVLSASSTGIGSGQLSFQVSPAPQSSVTIQSISPANGPVGSNVTITGTGFATPASGNTVAFYGNAPAIIQSGNATQLIVKVPEAAQTGGITVTNTANSASATSSSFTVEREQDYSFTASPAVLKIVQGSNGAANLVLGSIGTRAYTGLASLSVVDANGLPVSLPAGLTLKFEPSTLSAYQTGKLSLNAASDMALGSYTIIVQAKADISGTTWLRTSRITIQIIAKADVTGIKGRFVTPSGQGIQGVIVRQDNNVTVQTTSDAAGNFLLTGLASGAMTVRMDATPANPLYPIWPLAVVVELGQLITLSDWVINPPPAAEKYTPIQNATTNQTITDTRYPGFEITLPAGVTITGWDGVQKTRIAVERIEADKLPVPPPPIETNEFYQLHFGSAMGGIPSSPIPITMPNVHNEEPGTKVNMWWYDGSPMGGTGEWKIAGQGTVSEDGTKVVSDAGVGIPRFCGVCGLTCLEKNPDPEEPKPPCPTCPLGVAPNPTSGNPIDHYTGLEKPSVAGLSFGGLTPVDGSFKYVGMDPYREVGTIIGSFGWGWQFEYDIGFLPFEGAQKRLVMPGGMKINFVKGSGDEYYPSEYPQFVGAVAKPMASNPDAWEIKYKDGRIWQFSPTVPSCDLTKVDVNNLCTAPFNRFRGNKPTFLTAMIDPSGNKTTITRAPNGRILSVGSPNRQISFAYGSNGFVSSMSDSSGKTMQIEYVLLNQPLGATGSGITRSISFTSQSASLSKSSPASNGTNIVALAGSVAVSSVTAPPPAKPQYRVSKVTDAAGRSTSYTYERSPGYGWDTGVYYYSFAETDRFHIKSIQYSDKAQPTVNFYGTDRVLEQQGADGQTYRFAYRRKGLAMKLTSASPLSDTLGPLYGGTKLVHAGNTYAGDFTCTAGEIIKAPVISTGSVGVSGLTTTTSGGNSGSSGSTSATSGSTLLTGTTTLNTGGTISAYYGTRCPDLDSIENYNAGWRFFGRSISETIVTNPNGGSVSHRYNAQRQLTEYVDEFGQSTKYQYDGGLFLTQKTDPLGRKTQYTYDSVGNLLRTIDPLGIASGASYDPQTNSRVLTTYSGTDASGQVLQTNFEAHTPTGLPTRISDPEGRKTNLTYTSVGQLQTISNPVTAALGKTWNLAYNSAGDLSQIIDPLLNETRLSTDTLGRTVQATNPLGYTTEQTYNTLDQPLETKDALAQTTKNTFDANGRLTSVVNAAGVTLESYTYDSNGRLISTKDALNQTSSYIYNAAGQLTQSTDRKAQSTSYGYDLAGRISSVTEPDGSTSSYAYDAAGRLTQKRHNLQTSSYSYDDGDRLTVEATQTAAGSTTLAYTYDNANRPIQRKITFVGTGDPATTPSAPIQTTTYQWNKASQIIRIALSVGTTSATNPELVSTYTYDAAGRLASKTLPAAANTPANAQNIIQGIKQTYTFDVADRLSQIKYAKSDATLIDQIDYTYDAAGQRISKTMLNGNSAPETPMTATFDAGNRMQTITLNPGKPEQKIYNLTYDNNGNLTKKQLSTDANCTVDCTDYVWDTRNRLTQIKQNQTTSATYSYDAENRRIQTNITTNGTTNQVSYIYAGSQSVGEVRNQQLSHSLMTGLQMDEHIARIALNQGATPQVKTYLTDALGSVIATAKADQSLEVGYAFSPYGQTQKVGVENQQLGSENSSQYTGRENDNNGLYFYRARYYDPVLKRFISEDPISLDGGVNVFGYVEGDPVSWIDPEGLIETDPWWGYGNDAKFRDWWHRNKRGAWFTDSDEGFNRKKPYDIPNKECADRVKAGYDNEMEQRENAKNQRKSNGPRPERGRGDPKPKRGRGGGGRGVE
jgi:RHS repeat-associated protein